MPRIVSSVQRTATIALSDDMARLHAAMMAFSDAERRGARDEAIALWERSLAHTPAQASRGTTRVQSIPLTGDRARTRRGTAKLSLEDCDRAVALAPRGARRGISDPGRCVFCRDGSAGLHDLGRAASLGVAVAQRDSPRREVDYVTRRQLS